ncbi:hypothetical protein J2S36_000930 [Arcanobacterium hippocoleae]|uniref:Bacterial membrane flanked domain protein n=1 Tax=Arcanobacterium hippocoleae TaxID=149017 RepID=A0ABU1T1Z9_9ACTO|nr:hypothetical protein [Arcanobacterium hippocoleae]MDR6939387.1 hypothetical protein [Arcanobacterium hippocoleae]
MYVIFYDWCAYSYEVDEVGVRSIRSFVAKSSACIRWQDVASISISNDLILRLCNIVRIEISAKGSGVEPICIYGVDSNIAQIIDEWQRSCLMRAWDSDPNDLAPKSDSCRVLTAGLTPWECVGITFSHLYFLPLLSLVFGCFQFFFLGEQYSPDMLASVRIFFGHFSIVEQFAVVCLVVAIAIVLESVIVWLGFSNARSEIEGRQIRYSKGLVASGVQSIPIDEVEVITISQNPLMALLGRFNVAVLGFNFASKDYSSGRIATFVKYAQLQEILAVFNVNDFSFHRGKWTYLMRLMVFAAATSGAFLMLVFLCGNRFALVITLMSIVVSYAFFNRSRTFDNRCADTQWLYIEKAYLRLKGVYLRTSELHPRYEVVLATNTRKLIKLTVISFLGRMVHRRFLWRVYWPRSRP